MIYIYIAICVSMIIFNCVYVFILKRRDKMLFKDTTYFKSLIEKELDSLHKGKDISPEHKEFLFKKLKWTEKLTAFDKCIDYFYDIDSEGIREYLKRIYSVFDRLASEYKNRDTIKTAYFPYIVSKYNILKGDVKDNIIKTMFELLHSPDVYARENALMAVYSAKNVDFAIDALKIIDRQGYFHHPKLVCDGLLRFDGDKTLLCEKLFEMFDLFSLEMQINILNYIRFSGINCDNQLLEILKDKTRNQELHFSAIRYFEKYPNEEARPIIQSFAENSDNLVWQYQAISSSALKGYPDSKTSEILKRNLSSSNWYVRLNSAKSCEALGYTYGELINIFDGDDRYAREIIRYRLDRRNAEKAVAKQ